MISRHRANARMSQMVTYPANGRAIVTAGLVSDIPDADIAAQTADVLGKIDALLAEAGASKADVVQVSIWLPHITDFAAMNAVYDKWVGNENQPVRACVEARLADPRLRVEIQAFAVKT